MSFVEIILEVAASARVWLANTNEIIFWADGHVASDEPLRVGDCQSTFRVGFPRNIRPCVFVVTW